MSYDHKVLYKTVILIANQIDKVKNKQTKQKE